MRITCSGMSVIVSDGELKVRDKKISIKGAQFKIDPVTVESVENESVFIGDEKPHSWQKGTRLSKCKVPRLYHGLPGCMVPNSVIIKSSDGSTVYEENFDYLVDHIWGAIGRVEDGRIKKVKRFW